MGNPTITPSIESVKFSGTLSVLTEVTKMLIDMKERVGNDVVVSFSLNYSWLVISFEWPNEVFYSTQVPEPDNLPDLIESIINQANKHYKQESANKRALSLKKKGI